jgi:ankyrin repeat protein
MAENLAVNDHPENALQKIKILLDNGANYNQKACPTTSLSPIFWAVSLPLLLQQTEDELNLGLDESMKDSTDYCDIPKIVSKPCKQITPEEREKIRDYFHQSTIDSIKKLNPYFTKLIKLLIKRGADLTQTDERGQTVLHYAASMPKEITTEPLKILLEKGIDVDTQNLEKHTPLFFAYGAHNQSAINLLLDAGADPTMRDIEGILPKESKSVTLERTTHEDGSISIHLEN